MCICVIIFWFQSNMYIYVFGCETKREKTDANKIWEIEEIVYVCVIVYFDFNWDTIRLWYLSRQEVAIVGPVMQMKAQFFSGLVKIRQNEQFLSPQLKFNHHFHCNEKVISMSNFYLQKDFWTLVLHVEAPLIKTLKLLRQFVGVVLRLRWRYFCPKLFSSQKSG